ncbi:WbqC family protein [bacterium]|nr:WbqC family protein [bacterium]MBU1994475.1 WbqC family protein [bacterium]
MIVSAHQSAYNPWLGYMHKILVSDVFVVMDDVQFEKNSFINRNKILQNKNEIMLSIPIHTKDYKSKTIKDMQISSGMWKTKHLKSIEQSYKKSPCFEEVFCQLENIYLQESDLLIDYTNAFLDFLVSYLQIQTKIIYASSLNIRSKKLDYVIELTQKVGGDCFVFGSLARAYANEDKLKENGIIPYFQEYKHPLYQQMSTPFHPYMGILDLLFNENAADIKDIILKDNITKKELPCQKKS